MEAPAIKCLHYQRPPLGGVTSVKVSKISMDHAVKERPNEIWRNIVPAAGENFCRIKATLYQSRRGPRPIFLHPSLRAQAVNYIH